MSAPPLWWAFIIGTVGFIVLGVGIIVIIISSQRRYIAAQKEKMEALRKSQEQYSDLFNNVSDLIYIHSLEGNLLRANPAVTRFLGHEEAELVGKSIKSFIEPRFYHRFTKYVKELKKTGYSSGLLHLEGQDGGDYVFEYRSSLIRRQGKPVAVRGIARNVTEQQKAERALKESEERFRRLVHFAPLPIAVHTRGKWVFVNDAGMNLVGASRANDIIGRSIFHFIVSERRDELKTRMRQKMKDKNDVVILEEKLRRLDGEIIEVEIVAIPIIYDGRQAGQVVIRDITESKRLQEQLARAQRLETAGRVAGQIAHDFNNLLAPLTAYPTLIREELPDKHNVIELLDEMESAAEKISEINQQLLALGRRGHYSMELIDLNELIKRVITAASLPKQVAIHQELSQELALIKGGAAQLTRALTNLIFNAKEAMQGMGVLTVKTSNVALTEPLPGYADINPGGYVRLEITDTGCGIEPNILDRIFDPFFTTKKMDRMRGSGLGLSIVHGVIEDHSGYLEVSSKIGQGTSFVIYFPASQQKIIEVDKLDEVSAGNGEKILLVDDDPIQRRVTMRLLRRLGYKVHSVSSGEEAVAHVKSEAQDLLVLDMVMDGIDGVETYRQILEFNENQKAIILSGYAMSQRVEEALRLGAGAFVSKPVTPKVLANTIRKELDRGQQKNGNSGAIVPEEVKGN